MTRRSEEHRTVANFIDENLQAWVDAFITARTAEGLAPRTIEFYRTKINRFIRYCHAQGVTEVPSITPTLIRSFLVHLDETGHKPGGRHAFYRVVRAFLYFYENEVAPDNWVNPIRRMKAPKVPIEVLDPVDYRVVQKMIKTCKPGTFYGDRDRVILLMLLDTGVRARELLSIRLEDIDQIKGTILIRHGKGRKPRLVYFGKRTRRLLRKYLRHRTDDNPYLFVNRAKNKLTYTGLRLITQRRAELARVPTPQIHAFRRAFAINMLRQGVDIYTLAALMGHSTTRVLIKYLKITEDDTRSAHNKVGPVDRLLG